MTGIPMKPEVLNHDATIKFINRINDVRLRNVLSLSLEELLFPFVAPDKWPMPQHSLDLLFVAHALARVFTDRARALEKALSGQDIYADDA
jgi:hypothetical protein